MNDPRQSRPAAKVYRLLRLIWEAWRAVPLAATALFLRTVLLAATAPALPWATGRLVDALSRARGTAAFSGLVPYVLLIVGIRLAGSALAIAGGWFEARVQEAQQRHVLRQLLRKATRVPLQRYNIPDFHDTLYRAVGDFAGWQLHDLFWRSVYLLQGVLALAGLAWVAGRGDPLAPAIILGTGLLTMAVPWQFGIQSYALQRAMSPETRLLQYMRHLLTGRDEAKEVRLFGLGPYLLSRWQRHADALRLRITRQHNRQRLGMGIVNLAPMVAFAAALLLVVLRAGAHRIGVGAAVAALYALLSLQGQWEGVSGRFSEVWGWYLRAVGDLTTFLDEPELPVPDGTLPAGRPPIAVRDLSFTYPGADGPALRGVSFTLAPGEKVALVGENGAGKTTLVHLLLGLYAPTSGTIQVGDRDLRTVDPAGLWARTGAVFQDFMRYHLTVRENIGFGSVERAADPRAVDRAARAGGAAGFVAELPERYETVLGPTFGGRDLSVGQWQRVATARGLMPGGDLLVLDEPTAALDAKAEAEVYRAFAEHADGRTAILISHRMGFARLADRILVLKEGKLVEQGTHEDLVHQGGEYAQLFAAQAQWYA